MSADDLLIDIFLQPGEYFVGDSAFRIRTLLGSCVSITLWHRASQIGAMSHFLLPARPADGAANLDARYGGDAMALMLEDLQRLGINARQCEAKIFGGGNMFPNRKTQAQNVGQKNGEAAHAMLAQLGIPVVSEHLFGNGHRQIMFDVGTGDVWARQIPAKQAASGEWGDAA